jgi:serine/threonine protein kinase
VQCGTPSSSLPCAACGREPRLEGRFLLIEELGRGASGITFRATDVTTGERVTVKEIPLRRGGDPKQIELALREAEVLRQLHHAAIPRHVHHGVVGSGRESALFLVQQFIEGEDIEARLAVHRYDEEEIRGLVREILDVLDYLHRRLPPVLHRDLKPRNVIRETASGRHFVVDFGSVRDRLVGELGGSTVTGTFGYMAPEQMMGEAAPASDLYALGVLAIRLATRVEPTKMLDARNQLRWHEHVQLSPGFGAFLDRMVEPDVEKRIQTVAEARALLARASDKVGTPATPPSIQSFRDEPRTATAVRPAAWGEVDLEPRALERASAGDSPARLGARGKVTIFLLLWVLMASLSSVAVYEVLMFSHDTLAGAPAPLPPPENRNVGPLVKKRINPQFPKNADGSPVEPPPGGAHCTIQFQVGADGIVAGATAEATPSCPQPFADASGAAGAMWKFYPATADGAPVPSLTEEGVTFKLH